MISLKLPNWLSIPFYMKLKNAFQAWWDLVESWSRWPLNQMDIMTCHALLLDVVAYRRNIKRMRNESTGLYRTRIATAYINAKEAGTIKGLRNIFTRLGIPIVGIEQKIEGEHWATIKVQVTYDVASEYGELMKEILANYGKLCRSYQLTVISPVSIYLRSANFQFSSNTIILK